MLESQRITVRNILEVPIKPFSTNQGESLGGDWPKVPRRRLLTDTLFKYDVCALLHGVFLAKKELAGGVCAWRAPSRVC
jgi:CRISPR-associated protein Csb1